MGLKRVFKDVVVVSINIFIYFTRYFNNQQVAIWQSLCDYALTKV